MKRVVRKQQSQRRRMSYNQRNKRRKSRRNSGKRQQKIYANEVYSEKPRRTGIDWSYKADFLLDYIQQDDARMGEIQLTRGALRDYLAYLDSFEIQDELSEQVLEGEVMANRIEKRQTCAHVIFPDADIEFDVVCKKRGISYRWPAHQGKLPYMHDGQRKLLIMEAKFLSACISGEVLYLGAAPGEHINLLAEWFSDFNFVLYDPEPMGQNFVKAKNVEVNQKLFDLNEAKRYCEKFKTGGRRCSLYLISDIRTSTGDEPTNEEIASDMELQMKIFEILVPTRALLKVRFPFGDQVRTDIEYLGGTLIFQPWSPIGSNELRLQTSPDIGTVFYNTVEVSDWCTTFQSKIRGCAYGLNSQCYDCTFEDEVLFRMGDYGEKFAQINNMFGHRNQSKDSSIKLDLQPAFKRLEPAPVEEGHLGQDLEEEIVLDVTKSKRDPVLKIEDVSFERLSGKRSYIENLSRAHKQSALALQDSKTIVDLGGGRGNSFQLFREMGIKRVFLLDSDSKSIEEAIRRWNEEKFEFELYAIVSPIENFGLNTPFRKITPGVSMIQSDSENYYIPTDQKVTVTCFFAMQLLPSYQAVKTVTLQLKLLSSMFTILVVIWNYEVGKYPSEMKVSIKNDVATVVTPRVRTRELLVAGHLGEAKPDRVLVNAEYSALVTYAFGRLQD